MIIRHALPDDAQALLDLKLALDRESSFMMIEPGEREADVDAERSRLVERLAEPNSTILVVEAGNGELAGYLEAEGGAFRRNRHVALVIAGVRQSASGQGLGTQLFNALIDWAAVAGLARLELTVMAHNEAAIGLYRKMGFEVEGTRRAAMLVDGRFVDELYLARILS